MWWIILLTVLSFFALVLLSRLVMEIDSTHDMYAVKFGRLFAARLLVHTDVPAVAIKMLWWRRTVPLFGNTPPPETENAVQPVQSKSRQRMSPAKMARKAKGLLASFRITQCFISIDTGNMPLNGLLFPWFYMIGRRSGKKIMINFEGRTVVILRIENTIARLLWAYIKS